MGVYVLITGVLYVLYVRTCIDLTNDKEDEDEYSDEDHGKAC